jgi:hypothetical protein
MAQLSSFFGDAVSSGTSSEITDPSKLSFIATYGPNYLNNGNNSTYHDGQDTFWNSTDYNNSGGGIRRLVLDNIVQDTAGVADTWHTITDVSNKAGYWCWATGFSGHTIPDWGTTPVHSSLRITIDGTAYTRGCDLIRSDCNTASNLSWGRPFWGWTSEWDGYNNNHYYQSWSTNAGPSGRNTYAMVRSGEMSHMFGGTTPSNLGTEGVFYYHQTVYLKGREHYVQWGLPKVRFENSLKVEAKISVPHPSIAAGTNIGGATPTLNQHYYSDHAYSFHYYDTPTII